MSTLTDRHIGQLRNAGLTRPRAPYPGQTWTPRTDAERHLLTEGQRLDRLRLFLLEELGRLREQTAAIPRAEVLAAAARTAERLSGCPLSQSQLAVVCGAAAGEMPEETAARLRLSYDTVKRHRQRAVSRLQARSMLHAVALCVAAEWVTPGQLAGGVTP